MSKVGILCHKIAIFASLTPYYIGLCLWNHRVGNIIVNLVSGVTIHFALNGPYTVLGHKAVGPQTAVMTPQGIVWNNEVYPELVFSPLADDASFSLSDVTIGVNFHWERKETQTFLGTLRVRCQ